ncbi:DNA primase [Candidatus Nomurabacteria bacterium RIFCSPHIGHO2_02_FULL_42_19]|uniref:DNA primase n=1 Tax=Candidatus Nomurabacteria bacterium RIFCSPHIGHO2_02_FULL_42_19 TaxID=1801756 RepID=A0A1F6W135_9BACT|nr:MAG: DNA primase [Candidatus Nomurabacteria bacterium RIFCSPHIGHO2_02_FULL_42_19]
MNSPVAKIKERLSIEDVVSSYIKLERAGANLKAKCPFHNEKTPSFFVSPSRESYYCFGCGASGDIFTFVEEFEGLDFKGALKLLAARAGIVLEYQNKEEESEKEKLYKALEESTLYFSNNLKENKKVLEYLKSRGLSEDTIKDFRVGFAKDDWRELYNYLKKEGYSDPELERAGLVIKSEKGFYDRFRGRIMFPISDSSGRIIAFSGRVFNGDKKSAKYINSPETPIFSKSSVLYGLDRAKESIRKNNFSILVEGQMDLLLSHQAGYRNTVATSGTALSESTETKENVVSNLGLIRRLSENLVLAFDGDKAGLHASERAGRIALSLGMDVKVADMPPRVDPADLISKQGVPAWKEAVRKSKHIIEFLLDKVLKSTGSDQRKAGREVREKILPYVDALSSSIEKMHFLKKISQLSSIPESALQDDLKKVEQELKFKKKEIKITADVENSMHRKDYIERRLAGIAFWKKDKELENILGEVLNKYKDTKEDLIFEAEVFYGEGGNLDKDVEELLLNLKEESLREELGRKMRELYLAEENKNQTKPSQILKEIKEINDLIQNIKNNRIKK